MNSLRVVDKIKLYLQSVSNRLLDKDERKKLIGVYTYIVMILISYTMTIVNVFSDVGFLTWATFIMGCCCLIDLIIIRQVKNGENISSWLFAIQIIVLFSYFVVSGNPKGFSIIWLSLLPPIAMLFYGRKVGSIMSAIMFVIMIFFLWVPFGKELLLTEARDNYSSTFCLRFPFLYVGCYCLAFILDVCQTVAYNELEKKSDQYKYLTKHDMLTNINNRSGALEVFNNFLKNPRSSKLCIGIIDIDKFKEINDKYGHDIGDYVLVKFASILKEQTNVVCSRWGGDEFGLMYYPEDVSPSFTDDFCKIIRNTSFDVGNNELINITISGGIIEFCVSDIKTQDDINNITKKADELLYSVKNDGRNSIVIKRIK